MPGGSGNFISSREMIENTQRLCSSKQGLMLQKMQKKYMQVCGDGKSICTFALF